jgi:hypothetical protein
MPGRLTGGCGFTRGSRTGLPKSAPDSTPTCNSAGPFRRVGRGRRGMATHTARMPHGSADQRKSAGQVDIYWRRRVIALVAGLGMLALVTWTVNGALGGGSTRRTTDLSQTTGHHSAPAAPGSASATPSPAASAGASSAGPAAWGPAARGRARPRPRRGSPRPLPPRPQRSTRPRSTGPIRRAGAASGRRPRAPVPARTSS